MTLEFLIIPFFSHSVMAFVQCVTRGSSQYNDLLGLVIKGFSGSMQVHQILDIELSSEFSWKELFTMVLCRSKWLCKIGVLPFLLYLMCVLFLGLEFALKEQFDIKFLTNILFIVAFSFQIFYVYLKFSSHLPQLLMDLHKGYKTSSVLAILLDVVPVWKKHANIDS